MKRYLEKIRLPGGRWRRAVAVATAVAVLGVLTFLYWPMDAAAYLRPEPSSQILDREGRPVYAFLNAREQWCFPIALADVGPRLVQATLAAEDRRFRAHPGIDPAAVLRAVGQNASRGDVVSGASTLTMQVVKLRHGPARTVRAKAWQGLLALRLERHATKDEILEAYLNRAPYGQNLVGCEAAARRYFAKPARELTLSEAALLAGLPKAPTALMPLDNPDRARARRTYVLARMEADGVVGAAERSRADHAPLGARHHPFPALAPHLAMRLRPRLDHGTRLRTTLDAALQQEAERLVGRSVRNVKRDIGNAALIVVDVRSAEVLARVGSADFFDIPGAGQVDACLAPRSPGSALKPFTFALALERGRLYASEMLLDHVLDFGRFNPENFDEQYRGLVTASDALRSSLNVPAVTVLDRIGPASVHELLTRSGLTTLNKTPDYYGLGLTLGDCEVRLQELTAAYEMLANLGEYRPLRIVSDGPPQEPRRLLAPGTCAKIYEMLEQPLPSEMTGAVRAAGVKTRVCWKTGTSSGHRDAWAFVFNRQYLVGVWMGNNDGRPSRKLFGAWSALPLAGRMFRYLPATSQPAWPDTSDNLIKTTVCAVSGLPATKWCFQTREDTFPRNQFLNRACDMHYPAPGAGDTNKVVERWPGSAKGWDLAKIGTVRHAEGEAREEALQILSPADGAEFVLTGEAAGDRIRLSSSLDAAAPLHWYLDASFLGTATAESPIYLELKPGGHTLTCMTASGVTGTVKFNVVVTARTPKFD
ncbi:MAG: penicillin-binding protein 1C [FCB group bacterium]|jgi:penicillin-binding protein 1C|nr:penicillin-binding protein 1C [FCB group bacterium]